MAILIFWWILLLWVVGIIGFFAIRYWRGRGKSKHERTDVPVAHTTHLTDLPEYKAAFKKYRLLARWTAAALTIALVMSLIITARPAIIANVNPTEKNRDIMLCLDASGSVLKVDTMLINRFSALVNGFSGQRFGLTLFNSSAVTIIPLNDNYPLITSQLKTAGQAFQAQKGDVFTKLTDGTLAGFDTGTSLTSDGLASCVQHMGNNAEGRSQSIVLATDNEINGTPVVGMTQAVELAKQRGIHVFVVDPGVSDPKLAGDHPQLKIIAQETDGGYYALNDQNTVNSLIDDISKQAPAKFVGLPQPAINDNPRPFIYAAMLFMVISLAMLWRLEL